MNLEGLTLHILTNKLKEELLGGKIYKVFMPSYESLLLLVKRERDTAALLADFSCGSPMLYLPNNLPERPESPPAFCMLLRKHLEEGRITRIEQSGLDRIITIDIDTIGTARQIVTKQLIFELTGQQRKKSRTLSPDAGTKSGLHCFILNIKVSAKITPSWTDFSRYFLLFLSFFI